MGKNHITSKEETSSLERWRIINLDFPSKPELIQFLADHLAYQYKKTFINLEQTNRQEYLRREEEIPRFKDALKWQLKFILKFFKKLRITNESLILKIAFKKAKIKNSPKDSFKPNIEYRIEGLKFERIEY